MIIKIKSDFLKKIGSTYSELYAVVGKENADRLMLNWIKDMHDLFLQRK